jgi:uncharacterized protein YbjT (DUF2867 family)
MSEQKIIAVVGATGSQGGGLVRAIQADKIGGFAARAITRDVNSAAARELAALGAEVVACDVGDLDSLKKAFAGSYGAFCVTFYWDHMSPDREKAQADNMARAAKAGGLRHVVWSTLEDTREHIALSDDRMPTLMGKYKVPHLDCKAEADASFRDLGVPTTFLLTSFYWDNAVKFDMGPKKDVEGKLTLTLPMGKAKLAGIVAEDIGRCAYGVFQHPEEYIGKTIGIAGECLTGDEIAAAFTRALGAPVRYNAIEPEIYRGFGFPGADDLGNMFQYFRDFSDVVCGLRPLELARKLNPQMETLEQWLAENIGKLVLE